MAVKLFNSPRTQQPAIVSLPSDDPVAFIFQPVNSVSMANVLAENLSGKAVMGADGTELGMLYNITMDLKSGALGHLLVKPNEQLAPTESGFSVNDEGRIEIPVSRVQAVKDYIVVQR
jgi:sporulation protein YlmC with PRC-barrel domain